MKKSDVYGVVLWASAQNGTAVIWCEDQGDLAYVTPEGGRLNECPEITAGDLILCSVSDDDAQYRRAENLRPVQQGSHKSLSRMLVRRTDAPQTRSGNVVTLPKSREDAADRRQSYVA